jgi:triosephosphate isomerase
MARRKFICGNWKMHKTSAEAVQLVKELKEKVKTQAQVAVAPPFTALAAVKAALRGSAIEMFGQNCHDEKQGAFTGEVRAALEARLHPIVCVGETLQEREANRTWEVVSRQVRAAFVDMGSEQIGRCTLAYEPVWAIGTGKTATTEQAQEVHGQIRGLLRDLAGPQVAGAVRIQYGGSVKPENAADLLAQPDIDGALVGGASLKAEDFASIIAGAR